MNKLAILGGLLAANAALAACGPRLPVRMTLVNCVDQTPIEGAQIEHHDSVTRTDHEGHWDGEQMGHGNFAVEVHKTGFVTEKFNLKPGEERQTICMKPEAEAQK